MFSGPSGSLQSVQRSLGWEGVGVEHAKTHSNPKNEFGGSATLKKFILYTESTKKGETSIYGAPTMCKATLGLTTYSQPPCDIEVSISQINRILERSFVQGSILLQNPAPSQQLPYLGSKLKEGGEGCGRDGSFLSVSETWGP